MERRNEGRRKVTKITKENDRIISKYIGSYNKYKQIKIIKRNWGEHNYITLIKILLKKQRSRYKYINIKVEFKAKTTGIKKDPK